MRRLGVTLPCIVILVFAALPSRGTASAGAPAGETVLEGWVYEIETSPDLPGETPPSGAIVTRRPLGPRWGFGRVDAYLRPELEKSVFSAAGGRWCLLRGVHHDDEIVVGGRVLPRRAFDVLEVRDLRAFEDPYALRPALRGAILRDLFARGVDYDRDGTDAPGGGLSSDGRLSDGRRARHVALITPPSGSADMYSETAFVDARAHRYWAVREGGFAGFVRWVGPFDLPRRR